MMNEGERYEEYIKKHYESITSTREKENKFDKIKEKEATYLIKLALVISSEDSSQRSATGNPSNGPST